MSSRGNNDGGELTITVVDRDSAMDSGDTVGSSWLASSVSELGETWGETWSGLAMRKPPWDLERLKSPSMIDYGPALSCLLMVSPMHI